MAALPADLAPPSLPARSRPAPAPAPAPDPRRNLRVAPRPRRSGRYLVLMVILGGLGVFGCVALNALAAEQSFAVRELEQQVNELSRTADELTVDVTRLESPARLHREAVRTLGMVPAQQPAFVVLPDGASADSKRPSRTIAASASGD